MTAREKLVLSTASYRLQSARKVMLKNDEIRAVCAAYYKTLNRQVWSYSAASILLAVITNSQFLFYLNCGLVCWIVISSFMGVYSIKRQLREADRSDATMTKLIEDLEEEVQRIRRENPQELQ